MSQPAAQAEAASGGPSQRQIVMVMTGLVTGMFIGALDRTAVSSAARVQDARHEQGPRPRCG